ncbi:MAG: glutamate--tRNA ligase [Oscillospiraceae bacterium]
MDYKKLANLLFPNINKTSEYYEELYPMRELESDACVTRIGPSPTGFVHLGNLYNAIIGERLAHQSGGTFYLRVEDTDAKREVEGAVEMVLSAMKFFGIEFDEGATVDGDNGIYGPYRQRQRKDIYQCYAKKLVENGLAYPCFCTEEELSSMRENQMSQKLNFGYYDEWAKCRNLTYENIESHIKNGDEYVLRFKSSGDIKNHIEVLDGIRGILKVQENYQDFVLLKSDGIPTYHFAHVIDDHLMRTTHVVRGEEWLATLPIHVQLFDALGFKRPLYCHTAQLMKMDGDTKRKLSKRKDPELGLEYYRADGYSPKAVWEYLLTILNSNFEQWRDENPEADINDFKFTVEKMSNSGALVDMMKFDDVSRAVLVKVSASDIYDEFSEWLKEYDSEFYKFFTRDRKFSESAIDVGRDGERPRMDLTSWKQAKEFLSFYFDETFKIEDEFPLNVDKNDKNAIITKYLDTLDFNDDKTEWFQKVKNITEELGYALQPKKYKKNPELYKGSISDVSNVIRLGIIGRNNSPDIWEISKILGEECVRNRINKIKED